MLKSLTTPCTTPSLSFLAKHLVGVSCVAVLGVPGREVYYLYMASIVGKRQGNATYYYLVESARVDGKPRIVSQQYLGSAAEVMTKLSDAPAGEPVRTQHKDFGDLAAVWSVMQRLNVAGVIDAVVPRYANAAASVGPTSAWRPRTGSWRRARSWPSPTGGTAPPGRAGRSCAAACWTTASSGRRWTASTRST